LQAKNTALADIAKINGYWEIEKVVFDKEMTRIIR
jgi:hypothetical protein